MFSFSKCSGRVSLRAVASLSKLISGTKLTMSEDHMINLCAPNTLSNSGNLEFRAMMPLKNCLLSRKHVLMLFCTNCKMNATYRASGVNRDDASFSICQKPTCFLCNLKFRTWVEATHSVLTSRKVPHVLVPLGYVRMRELRPDWNLVPSGSLGEFYLP